MMLEIAPDPKVIDPAAVAGGADVITFADIADAVFAHGFVVVPIPRKGYRYGRGKQATGKGPIERGWQSFAKTQTAQAVRRLARRSPGWGLGILTGRVVGTDIDVLDEATAEEIVALARRRLGAAGLMRVGRAPKTMLVYRTEAPFAKINSRVFVRPGEEQEHRIEVLGNGQQFVAFAVHPDTGAPYRWIGQSPRCRRSRAAGDHRGDRARIRRRSRGNPAPSWLPAGRHENPGCAEGQWG
jgi:hypothetical protein